MSEVFTIFFCCLVSGLIVAASAHITTNRQWEKGAIERGHAQYCPLDGEFAWNGECANEK